LRDFETNTLPFLKWAGGKRWLLHHCQDLLPAECTRYFEPFLGGGAVFFALQPNRAVLSDLNGDLISTFLALRKNWKPVARLLQAYNRKHCKAFYYKLRNSRPTDGYAKAARFIYLNRTCWNGLYRVNKKGDFNVPIGTKTQVILTTDDFGGVSKLLSRAELLAADFESIVNLAGSGDFVFADPPYVTQHSQNGFLKYNERLFSWGDQIRLRDALTCARKRGAYVIATNADTPHIRRLYQPDFSVRSVVRPSVIAAATKNRGLSTELVIWG
jgi:DNA adenine methylase